MSSRVARLFLGLVLGLAPVPGIATPLTFSGPGLAPCPEGQCVDLRWEWDTWDENSPYSTRETIVALPSPDPTQWVLTGGSIHGSPSAASFDWYFYAGDLEEYDSAGYSIPVMDVIGSDGSLLTRNSTGLAAICYPQDPEPAIRSCGDGNGTSSSNYYPTVVDPALLGPITFRYDFQPVYYKQPLSESYRIGWTGAIHLVYTAVVPEPGGAAILATGLLVLAAARKL
jgi:hypothetical protein